jgi:hypothetical protein
MTQVPAGRYRLLATSNYGAYPTALQGFYGGSTLDSAKDIVIKTGETKKNINVILGATEFDSAISGLVTAGGKPVSGIEVGLINPIYQTPNNSVMPFIWTKTDQQGRYRLEGLSIGPYQVAFRDPAGLYATTLYTPSNDFFSPFLYITQTAEISNINISLSPGGTIRGHVRVGKDQQAGGYLIQILSSLAFDPFGASILPYIDERSNANGAYEVKGVPPGTYTMRIPVPAGSEASPTTYFYYGLNKDISAPLTVTLTAGQQLNGIDIYLFTTPDTFLPSINIDSALASPTPTPTEGPLPPPSPPIATATPTPPFMR